MNLELDAELAKTYGTIYTKLKPVVDNLFGDTCYLMAKQTVEEDIEESLATGLQTAFLGILTAYNVIAGPNDGYPVEDDDFKDGIQFEADGENKDI